MEELENRWVPAVISTWNAKTGISYWSNPDNWTNGVPQAAGDQATFTFQSLDSCIVDIPVILDELTITSDYTGTITVNQSLKIGNANLTSRMANGILTGNGIDIAAGTFDWTGGTFQNVTTPIYVDRGATVNITGTGTKTLDQVKDVYFAPATAGTWDGAGPILFKNGSKVTNFGTFTITGSGTIQDGGGGLDTFINDDTLTLNPAINQVTMHVYFQNDAGICDISSGSFLYLDGSSTLAGTISVDNLASLTLAATEGRDDDLRFLTIKGQGSTNFKSNVRVSASISIETTVYDNSITLDGDGTLSSSGTYYWYGNGPWKGTGQMKIVAGELKLNGNGPYALGRTIDNQATVTWKAGDIKVNGGANIINENNATFHIQTDNNIVNGGGAGSFQNQSGATLVKDGGAATTRIDLVFFPYNGGTIQVTAPGARIKFTPFMLNNGFLSLGGVSITVTNVGMDFSAGFEQDSGSTSFASGATGSSYTVAGGNLVQTGGDISAVGSGNKILVTGQYQEKGGTTTVNFGGGISVTGQYLQSGGTTTVANYTSISVTDQYIESGGTVELQTASITATNGFQVLSGADLRGLGSVTASTLTNSGIIEPGDIGGTGGLGGISITGNYTQTSTGVLNEDMYWSGSSMYSDHLSCSGQASLHGTLNVTLLQSPPPIHVSSNLMGWGSVVGAFDTPNIPAGWKLIYNPTYLEILKVS